MHPCYLSKLERKGRLFEKDADLKLWPMGGGGGGGGAPPRGGWGRRGRLLGEGCLFREWALIRGNTLY